MGFAPFPVNAGNKYLTLIKREAASGEWLAGARRGRLEEWPASPQLVLELRLAHTPRLAIPINAHASGAVHHYLNEAGHGTDITA